MKMMALLVALVCLTSAALHAQINADSLAYQLQRKKINDMLNQREQKFGLYEESLSKHTGIFGLQTKKDIRRSNEILMDITKTDNDIFKQLKILLDYRTFEQKQVQSHTSEIQSSNLAYMNTINKLRNQNDKLLKQVAEAEQKHNKQQNIYLLAVLVLMVTSILLLLTRKRATKA